MSSTAWVLNAENGFQEGPIAAGGTNGNALITLYFVSVLFAKQFAHTAKSRLKSLGFCNIVWNFGWADKLGGLYPGVAGGLNLFT